LTLHERCAEPRALYVDVVVDEGNVIETDNIIHKQKRIEFITEMNVVEVEDV
jgi:hypothetical protein